jgi:hypothetical protein
LGSFKNSVHTERAQNFRQLFPHCNTYAFILTKMVWLHFGRLFHKRICSSCYKVNRGHFQDSDMDSWPVLIFS